MEVHHTDQIVSLEGTYGVSPVVLVVICFVVEFLEFLGFLEPFDCCSEIDFHQRSEMTIHLAREVDEEPLAVFLENQLVVFAGWTVVLKFEESPFEEEQGH